MTNENNPVPGDDIPPVPQGPADDDAAHRQKMSELFGDLEEEETPDALREKLARIDSSIRTLQQEKLALTEDLSARKEEAADALEQAKRQFEDQTPLALEKFLGELLPLVDGFKLGLAAVSPEDRAADPKFDKYLQGMEKALGQLVAAFNKSSMKSAAPKNGDAGPDNKPVPATGDAPANTDVPQENAAGTPNQDAGKSLDEMKSERDALLGELAQAGTRIQALQREKLALMKKIDAQKEEAIAAIERTKKQLEEQKPFVLTKCLKEMLPAIDNLDRGLAAITPEERAADPKFDNYLQGMEKNLGQLTAVFNKFGIKAINPKGEEFDPNLHEAIGTHDDPDAESETVIAVVQKGYELNGRLIRPARVIIKP